MRLNSRGQITIPAWLRAKHHLQAGDEVDVIEDGDTLRIVRADGGQTRGHRLVSGMRGKATINMSTDELMELLRSDQGLSCGS